MRILLIAYDFPPLASPQAIRWYYLTRELVRSGVEVHVLAPDLPVTACSLEVPAGVVVHRCNAGGLAGWLARRRAQPSAQSTHDVDIGPASTTNAPGARATLNWKGRLHKWLDALIGLWCYPDSRGQWRQPAYPALRRVVAELRPDIVISSHEPAMCLELGLHVAADVKVWLADLGDPVLAPYTPKRWRRRANRLEARVCGSASSISVTTGGTRDLLIARHGMAPEKVFVLRQGYDDSSSGNPWTPHLKTLEEGGDVHLLYTGRFYPFRDPLALFEAVAAQPRVRLTVVAPEVKTEYLEFAERSGGRIVFMGEQPHHRVLELQSECDVLVNIGNALNAQTPGKLFEYLGSGKPILHCYSVDADPASALVEEWGRGWVCHNDQPSLRVFLAALIESPQQLCATLSGDNGPIVGYGWSRLAQLLLQRCQQAVAEQGARAVDASGAFGATD
jgi:glycosyltransferase involved in cell wall biosynthesis